MTIVMLGLPMWLICGGLMVVENYRSTAALWVYLLGFPVIITLDQWLYWSVVAR